MIDTADSHRGGKAAQIAYWNDNIAVTTNMFCLPDGDQARHLYAGAKVEAFTQYFFNWLDSIPRPHGFCVSCLPVKIKGASAGWCRAAALVPAD